ncbi:uncharacterized protein LOC143266651 [Megachile rotundata]|uniref:uncharacterized protein LOC143266651 n=1 Tax=Megachile rotundata TaxID=143995 RepID=UPI003FD6BC44
MDGVMDIREGIEKMDLVRNPGKEEEAETSVELEKTGKRKEEKEKKGQKEEERRSAEKEHALSRNKIRKILNRLLQSERRSRGRGGGRHSGWRRGGRGGINKNYFVINQNR